MQGPWPTTKIGAPSAGLAVAVLAKPNRQQYLEGQEDYGRYARLLLVYSTPARLTRAGVPVR